MEVIDVFLSVSFSWEGKTSNDTSMPTSSCSSSVHTIIGDARRMVKRKKEDV